MKERTKETLRDGFGVLINNAAAIRGAKNGPLWLTILFFVFSLLLPVVPVFVSQANIKGSTFINTYSYGLEKTMTSMALNLKNDRNMEFAINDNHEIDITEGGNPINYANYSSEIPFATYENTVTGQYDLMLYVSDVTKNADKKTLTTAISASRYTIKSKTRVADTEKENVYSPSYIVLFKNGLYVCINGANQTKAIASSYSGDFKTMKSTTTGLTDLLKVTDKEGNNIAQDIRNDDYANGVLKNFKAILNKSYESLKIQNMFGTTGIYIGIFAGASILMGFLMWILTRGKNNPNNYYTPWLTAKIEARLGLSPAIITLVVGFFLTSQVPLIFILTLGLRVMWISMKELRPIQQ